MRLTSPTSSPASMRSEPTVEKPFYLNSPIVVDIYNISAPQSLNKNISQADSGIDSSQIAAKRKWLFDDGHNVEYLIINEIDSEPTSTESKYIKVPHMEGLNNKISYIIKDNHLDSLNKRYQKHNHCRNNTGMPKIIKMVCFI